MKQTKILDITIPTQSKQDILDKIIKYIRSPQRFFDIVSLNPENLILAQENYEFKKVVETAQIKIIDGVGVVLASRFLGVEAGERVTGVGLMEELIKWADKLRLRVLLIGGKPNLALELADCYSGEFSKAKFKGLEGIKNIRSPMKEEEKQIFDIVRRYKPHMIFVAFGSPDQELWLGRHKKQFFGMVVMGVGGAFDFISGKTRRASPIIQKLGLEWLFRLIYQPWRWKRQLRLLKFISLVFKEKWKKT